MHLMCGNVLSYTRKLINMAPLRDMCIAWPTAFSVTYNDSVTYDT